MADKELYFEIVDAGNLLRLDPLELSYSDSDIDWDGNWIKTRVTVRAGVFSGQYIANFMTVDFEKFKQELLRLHDTLKGDATFNGLEKQLKLEVRGDGLGHIAIEVTACDEPSADQNVLIFSMHSDQTQLRAKIDQLDRITKQFPITGDLKST